ncbi:type IV secretion protein Rhs [Escherichia coli]|nr:type IV secretion protein Rhs [Escherichia coli]
MSGKPAARQGDMTHYGGSIVQGSAWVRLGATAGGGGSV